MIFMACRTVLFVCHANTCRSVIAQELLRKLLREHSLEDSWQVRSGGIAAYARDGALVSLEARLVLRDEGIELEETVVSTDLKRNRHLVAEADLILAMTEEQVRMLRQGFPEADGKPVLTLKEFAGEHGDIDDPFGREEDAYLFAKNEIYRCLRRALPRLMREAA